MSNTFDGVPALVEAYVDRSLDNMSTKEFAFSIVGDQSWRNVTS